MKGLSEQSFNAIVDSCTLLELKHPELMRLHAVRIARGSGRSTIEVRRLARALKRVRWAEVGADAQILFSSMKKEESHGRV